MLAPRYERVRAGAGMRSRASAPTGSSAAFLQRGGPLPFQIRPQGIVPLTPAHVAGRLPAGRLYPQAVSVFIQSAHRQPCANIPRRIGRAGFYTRCGEIKDQRLRRGWEGIRRFPGGKQGGRLFQQMVFDGFIPYPADRLPVFGLINRRMLDAHG